MAGLLCCFGGASLAATTNTGASAHSDEASKPAEVRKHVRHKRLHTHRRSSRTALKSSDHKADMVNQGARKNAANEVASDTAPASNAMPSGFANARAEIASADTAAAAAASAMTARAADNKQAAAEDTQIQPVAGIAADNQTVSPDQLNEVDRALHEESQPAAPRTVVAAVDTQPRPVPVMAAATADSSSLDQTSLIGKIFIGFGALLTLASAARMFMV
ncbi:hypothetical protein [Bradyrhizobium sp.]|uniref:hypothetical protein n=1 Tax=Bradyrhizobium sp. TaxID=376 RepID=UPI00345BD025